VGDDEGALEEPTGVTLINVRISLVLVPVELEPVLEALEALDLLLETLDDLLLEAVLEAETAPELVGMAAVLEPVKVVEDGLELISNAGLEA